MLREIVNESAPCVDSKPNSMITDYSTAIFNMRVESFPGAEDDTFCSCTTYWCYGTLEKWNVFYGTSDVWTGNILIRKDVVIKKYICRNRCFFQQIFKCNLIVSINISILHNYVFLLSIITVKV